MSKSSLLPIRMGSMNNPTRVWSWSHKHTTFGVTLGALLLATGLWILDGVHKPRMTTFAPFYHSVRTHDDLCVGGVSHSGYIGLQGDAKDSPRRSFFWYFEAQNIPETAPVILTIGGGPGSSGMANPLFGQSHCRITKNSTTVPNPNAWSENYNLIALDHPIGVGFSYGAQVNNSRAAAYDAYDFLTKFFALYPHLANNKLILAGGSYGGTYVPHIATVIHEQNTAVASGSGTPGARHLKLDSMMVSNPLSDFLSHNRWKLQQRCFYTDLYNATVCTAAYEQLPFCLEAVQMAYTQGTVASRAAAIELCDKMTPDIIEGRSHENVNTRCNGTTRDCMPQTVWATEFMNKPETKQTLGAKADIHFTLVNRPVHEMFVAEGDPVQQAYLLYEPLLGAGYRLLHYIGELDANCAWPGVLSMLRLIHSPYQREFIAAPDLPWTGENATVRVVGPGAGNFTYVLMGEAGHMVTMDQPDLVKKILGHWIDNVPFV